MSSWGGPADVIVVDVIVTKLFELFGMESVSPYSKFLARPHFIAQIKLNLAIVMVKRVCAIVVIVLCYNPVLYQLNSTYVDALFCPAFITYEYIK